MKRTTACFLAAMTALAAQAAYEQLPELISAGRQFVPTDFSLAYSDIIEVSFKTGDNFSGNQTIFCNRASAGTGNGVAKSFSLFLIGTTPRWHFGSTVKSTGGFKDASNAAANTAYVVNCHGGYTATWTVDGASQPNFTKVGSFTPGGPLSFFASYETGGGDAENGYTYSGIANYAQMTFYYAKVWASDGTTLKHHLVPAKDSDYATYSEKYGLLDIADPEAPVFYPNKGSAALISVTDAPLTADLFVTPEGRGEKTGATWSDALGFEDRGLQKTLDEAIADGVTEINAYFAAGEYTVTNQLVLISPVSAVNLRGGYLAETDGSLAKGGTTTTFRRTTYDTRHLYARSIPALHLEDITFRDGLIRGSVYGGSLHLERAATTVTNCVFSGNVARQAASGQGNSYHTPKGGAIYATGGSLSLLGCRFADNYLFSTYAVLSGGAVCTLRTDLLIDRCTFSQNNATANHQKGGVGGAVCVNGGTATIEHSTFEGNYAISGINTGLGYPAGGALAVRSATRFELTDCLLTNNFVRVFNGTRNYPTTSGFYLDDLYTGDGVMTAAVSRCVFHLTALPTTSEKRYTKTDICLNGGYLFMTNCLVFGASGSHGQMTNSVRVVSTGVPTADFNDLQRGGSAAQTAVNPSHVELVNCTIADGVGAGAVAVGAATMSLVNCVVRGNRATDVVNAETSYSCLQTAHDGAGNFVADPHWTGAPYYHLLTKRSGGAITDGWFGGTYNSPKTEKNSPCLDAGAPDKARAALEPRPNGRRVNLGAYGGTPWASLTLSPPGTMMTIR